MVDHTIWARPPKADRKMLQGGQIIFVFVKSNKKTMEKTHYKMPQKLNCPRFVKANK